jgi:hypothetical protein
MTIAGHHGYIYFAAPHFKTHLAIEGEGANAHRLMRVNAIGRKDHVTA